jgi:hypothetical protein
VRDPGCDLAIFNVSLKKHDAHNNNDDA